MLSEISVSDELESNVTDVVSKFKSRYFKSIDTIRNIKKNPLTPDNSVT